MTSVTIFLSAFLLFLVQPIIAKLILPQFGGGVAVWATCLVFFQVTLLLGYAYAHQVVKRDRSGQLRWLHIALLIGSLLVLPIVPEGAPAWLADAAPGWQILALLMTTIGAPFALLASTSPLLQAWLAQQAGGRDPYRLFVVSNLASLAALMTYPWLIEPWLGTVTQAMTWSALYGAYVVMASWVAFMSAQQARLRAAAAPPAAPVAPAALPAIGAKRLLGWIALAALASYELVAVTNHLTQNIPSMPMMWVLPLGIYLLTFTLCFDGRALVSAAAISRRHAAGGGRDVLDARRLAAGPPHRAADVRLRVRLVRTVHGLPRRVGARPAAAAAADAVLPVRGRGWRARRRGRRPGGAGRCCRAPSRSRSGWCW